MIALETQRKRVVGGRARAFFAGLLVIFVACVLLPGCSGEPSKEEQAKLDAQGKQTNEEGMKRMIQEQGKVGGMPPAGQK